jgi:hypothetical protein
MSLFSASNFITGIKDYAYHGIQQLPLLLAMTSFLFTITTGSIAHTTMFFGIAIVTPILTLIFQALFRQFGNPEKIKRSSTDVCNVITDYSNIQSSSYYDGQEYTVPSYWITCVSFFFGYVIYNAIQTFKEPADTNGKCVSYEKRRVISSYILFFASIIFIALLIIRFTLMGSCEGSNNYVRAGVLIFAAIFFCLGIGAYEISRSCGARSSDLLGILSQALPISSTMPSPTVCMATISD